MLSVKLGRRVPMLRQVGCSSRELSHSQGAAMLRYAIVLQVALVVTAASSAADTQPTAIDKMSTVHAIKACRAEVGRHGRYSPVRKCVSQKRMSTVEAINACRAELGKNGKYLQVRKCVTRKMKDR
jgi:hypothetical protein